MAEHEIATAGSLDTQDTRLGLRARPWSGGRFETRFARAQTENGARLLATTGLIQQLRLSDRWTVDFGADRVRTLSDGGRVPSNATFNPAQPPANGSFDNDFTAAFVGAALRRPTWTASTRLEFHAGDLSDRWNLLLGSSRQLSDGRALSASVQWLSEHLVDGGLREVGRARFGLAWRPPQSGGWVLLARFDLESDRARSDGFDTHLLKAVWNAHAGRQWRRHELSVHLGAKQVVQQFLDAGRFRALTLASALDYRFDLSPRWDLGVHGGVHGTLDGRDTQHQIGVSVGRSMLGNAWVSAGYNFAGYSDPDLTGAHHRQEGVYVKFRLRFGQAMASRFLAFVGRRDGAGDSPPLVADGR